jgi:transposase-like protein
MSLKTAQRMTHLLRERMLSDAPPPFSGTCEADETFIGGQRKNKRLHIRRRPCKSGHGTEKVPIVGVLSRRTGTVRVAVLDRRCEETVIGFMVGSLRGGALLYTDGYKMNRAVRKHGVRHHYVNHHLGEMVRGAVHTNGIEGFWGVLKRRLGCIGGMRHDRLPHFVAEIAWRFNHRKLSINEQEELLLRLLFDD